MHEDRVSEAPLLQITHGRTEQVIEGFNVVDLNPQIELTISSGRLTFIC
jgi:hypothetical protein